jgi:hypothetical protein
MKLFILPVHKPFMQPTLCNKEIIFHVPSNRNKDDPFYVIPEIETDTRVYWTGYDIFSQKNVLFSCFKSDLLVF